VGPTAPVTGAQGKTFSGRYSTFATIRERRSQIFDSIVTCDETWVHYFTPESKRGSKQWKHPFSTPKNAKAIFSVGKIMATVFWDSKAIIHLDFLTGQKTINMQYYSTLLND
jgi:hypothetical protein